MQCSDDIERNETRPDFIQHGQHQTRTLYAGTGPLSMDLPHNVHALTSKQAAKTNSILHGYTRKRYQQKR